MMTVYSLADLRGGRGSLEPIFRSLRFEGREIGVLCSPLLSSS